MYVGHSSCTGIIDIAERVPAAVPRCSISRDIYQYFGCKFSKFVVLSDHIKGNISHHFQ
jgi:hypothetical protein